ncbi:MAG: SRPBCC family protein [Candidatus Competibacteraceae bacterium]
MNIQVSEIIDSSAEHAWRILIDTRCWPEWGPSVKAVDCAERYIRKGSTGRVLTTLGFWADFEIIYFEEGRYWDWRVYGIAATAHRVEPLGEHRCRVSFEIPLFAAPYALICKLALRRIAKIATQAAQE